MNRNIFLFNYYNQQYSGERPIWKGRQRNICIPLSSKCFRDNQVWTGTVNATWNK